MSVPLETVTLAVYPDHPSADGRRSLASWLRLTEPLRGRVTWAVGPDPSAPTGSMSGVTDVLVVAVGGGGAIAVLVQAIVGWLSRRGEDVTVRITGTDGQSVELEVRQVRDLTQVAALVENTVRALEHGRPPAGTEQQ
ncbi:effector-associated constant component EACC1 [Micromonospora echinospora]|uniref:effector-associated constant component EACC1 n=1 Tax=Micromonospora echinospora TaxID=1877 RepID=UPI003A88BB0A